MDCEEPSELHLAVAAWLEAQILQQHSEEGCMLLPVDVIELACSQRHPEVVSALLTDPEVVRQAAIAVLERAQHLAGGQRLWLRPRQLMAAAELSVAEALECMRCGPGALFSCHGVCMAATALFQQPAARTFQCACCARVTKLHSAAVPPPCCGGELKEVETARVMVQGQVLFLCTDTPLPYSPAAAAPLGVSLVAVHLADDLCGRVRVGDRVLATGCGRYYGGCGCMAGPQAGQLPLTLGVKMEACNVEVLHPVLLTRTCELGAGAARHLVAMAAGGLDAVLQVLDAALPVAASPMLKLALLLSAAAAGTWCTLLEGGQQEQEEDPEPQTMLRRRAAASRNQVHVMLTAAGPEPPVQRFLSSAASALCDHSVRATADDPRALLPSLDPKWVEPSLGLQVPLALGGQLAEAAPGVLLLSSSCLDTKHAVVLGQVLVAGEAVLHPGCPELRVPIGATLWTMVHEQDLSKSARRSTGSISSGSGGGLLSLTERIINHFSHPFFAQHDLLVSASPETEEEVEAMMDGILLGRAVISVATPGHPGGCSRERTEALSALRHQVQAARAQAQPVLASEAGALLAAYFQHLRTRSEAQQGVLASLVRVACASARLRHSAVAEALPDAALAVAFLEEKLAAAGASPLFWPRWRQELQHCTELEECLQGLLEDCHKGLSGMHRTPSHDVWMQRAEE